MKNTLLHFFILLGLAFIFSCNTDTGTEEDTTATDNLSNPDARATPKSPVLAKTILKDTTAASLLNAVFGNFDANKKQAIVDIEMINNDDFLERFDGGGGDAIIAQLEGMENLPDGRSIFIVSIKPEEGYDCRICAPLLGAGVLKNKKGEWHLGGLDYLGMGGTYGIAPDFSTKKIGTSDYALVQSVGDLHMGYFWSAEEFFSVNRGFPSILSVNTHHDNSGTCNMDNEPDSDFGPCFENDTKIAVVPSKEGGNYYEIHTYRTGTDYDFDQEKLLDVDEKRVYTFQDNKYVEQNEK